MTTTMPPVLLVLLSTTYLLATASDSDVCEVCSRETENNHIRLKDTASDSSAGQIQVCASGYWQTVCSSTQSPPGKSYPFTEKDATVACFQLGLTKGVPGPVGEGCEPGNQPTFLAVSRCAPCKGWEQQLSACLQPVRAGICTIQTAASVRCQKTAQVMLEHGNTSSYLGKALHYFNTTWRTVCDKNWTATMSNSHVLCRQLGLGHAVDHWLHVPGERDVNFLHTNMKCSGTENKLRLCEHNFIADGDCSGESVPWVVCSGLEASGFKVEATSTSISLQWTVPEALQYYPVVDGYNITYREQGTHSGSKAKHHTQPEVTIGGLSAGTQYLVTVMVVLKGDRPGPETTLVISTNGYLVIGLASGLGVSLFSMLLACVLAVSVGVFAYLKTRAHQKMRGPYQDIDDANDSDDAHDSDEEREEQHQGNVQLHLQNPAAGENEEQRLLPRRNEEEQPEQPAAVDEQVPAEQPGAAVVRRGYCSFL